MSVEDDLEARRASRAAAAAARDAAGPPEPDPLEVFCGEFVAAATKRDIQPDSIWVVDMSRKLLVGTVLGWGAFTLDHDGDSRSPDPVGVITLGGDVLPLTTVRGRIAGIRGGRKGDFHMVIDAAHLEGDGVRLTTDLREEALSFLDRHPQ